MLTMRRKRHGTQAGITLVELLIAMIILGIVSTMLIGGWASLQRASAFALRTDTARATARDAMGRISSELRDAQPATLPTAAPTATSTPTPQPPLTLAQPMEVRFYSSFNSSGANADGSGTAALRQTRIWLDTSGSAPQKTLYWQRDLNGNGSFTDTSDRSMVLARNVVNNSLADATNGTSYTAIFRYAYRDGSGNVQWTDNSGSSLVLSTVVAIRVRLIIDANMSRTPTYVDITTTVRPRNASSD